MNASPLRIPIRVRAALAAGSALLLAGCANATQPAAVRGGDEASGRGRYPVTVDVMDDAGKKLKQTVGAEPKRVVVIGQALAELMVEFGLDDRIVGVGYLGHARRRPGRTRAEPEGGRRPVRRCGRAERVR
ncbi:hypothetical protein OG298_13695 [Streptomyces sp. NBC_01005]|uniref:hypothetical protein n=1 Tax=unclassified Streptomyces TaxID=2593676 RepID=UPI003865316D|nr:hypothetical protein OG298_13695 [Streptomyces sp. NBC_01005]WTC94836.1 hypothetical protein OH736_13695 [Streptomyces sp. NBC_01650]